MPTRKGKLNSYYMEQDKENSLQYKIRLHELLRFGSMAKPSQRFRVIGVWIDENLYSKSGILRIIRKQVAAHVACWDSLHLND